MTEYLPGGALPPPRDIKHEGERVIPWRIVGDSHQGEPESYVPMSDSPRSRAVLQRLFDGPTPEERERWDREAASAEVERREALGQHIARHVALADEHRDHPVLLALLDAHGPHQVEIDGMRHAECHGCPTFYSDDDEGGDWYHHAWPCPTWTTIAEQTGGAA